MVSTNYFLEPYDVGIRNNMQMVAVLHIIERETQEKTSKKLCFKMWLINLDEDNLQWIINYTDLLKDYGLAGTKYKKTKMLKIN